MSRLRWGVAALAVTGVGLLATPASANTKTVLKGKELDAVVTDCPASSAVGTECSAWLLFVSQTKVNDNGTVDKSGAINGDLFHITITAAGFDSAHVGVATGTPKNFKVADNLSRGSASGSVDFQCDPGVPGCTNATFNVSLQLAANAKANFVRSKSVSEFDGCRTIDRFNFRSRTADGSARIGGAAFVTTTTGPFLSTIGTSGDTYIERGTCPTPLP